MKLLPILLPVQKEYTLEIVLCNVPQVLQHFFLLVSLIAWNQQPVSININSGSRKSAGVKSREQGAVGLKVYLQLHAISYNTLYLLRSEMADPTTDTSTLLPSENLPSIWRDLATWRLMLNAAAKHRHHRLSAASSTCSLHKFFGFFLNRPHTSISHSVTSSSEQYMWQTY